MQVEQAAAQMSAAERAAEAAEMRRGVQAGMAAQTPEQWDQIVTQFGLPDLVGQFEVRDAWLNTFLDAADVLERSAPPEEPASITALRIRAQEAGLEPGTEAYTEFMRQGGKVPQGMVVETTPDGGMRFAQGEGVGGGDFKFTEQQSKDNVYATRARGALEVLEPVAPALVNRGDRVLEYGPLGIGREFQGDDYQVAQQAGTEFLQAILRKDTGAAITQDETESYGRVYLPQPGDSEAVQEAKRQARIRAINAIEGGMSPIQMLARDRALISAARESAEGRQDAESGGDQPPEQPPAYLSEEDRALWPLMTPMERRAIMQDYPNE